MAYILLFSRHVNKKHNYLFRFGTSQFNCLIRLLGLSGTTYCAWLRWCWPLDSSDVTPGNVVDSFCLLGILIIMLACVWIRKMLTNKHHDVSRKNVSRCSVAFWRTANFVSIPYVKSSSPSMTSASLGFLRLSHKFDIGHKVSPCSCSIERIQI